MLSCISLHESKITTNIRCKHARQTAVDASFGHEVLLSENANPANLSVLRWGVYWARFSGMGLARINEVVRVEGR